MLTKIEKYVLHAVVFLVPIVILPISPNIFTVGRLAILVFGVLVLFLIKAVPIIHLGRFDLNIGKYDFPVLLITIAYLVSTIFRSPNKMEALLLPGTTAIMISGTLLYFLINQQKDSEKKSLLTTLFFSSVAYSSTIILAYSKVLAKVPQLPEAVKIQFFTPEGGYLPSAIFLASLFLIGLSQVINAKKISQKALFIILTFVLATGLSISVYNLLPGKTFAPRFPGYANDWNIAIDSLKESPILGVGPGNYLTAFNRFRPLSFNNSNLWAIKFTAARSFYLTILTETGLLGAAGIILLFLSLYRSFQTQTKKSSASFSSGKRKVSQGFSLNLETSSLLLVLVLFLFFPATLVTTITMFVILASISQTEKTSLNLKTQGENYRQTKLSSLLPALIVSLPILILVVVCGYYASRILVAEVAFNRAITAFSKNDAQTTYNQTRKAIKINPKIDRYHLTFSQITLALANSVVLQAQNTANQATLPDQQISEADRTNITQLVQLSISEAKAAVSLNPYRSGNWENLGKTYLAIIPLAQGADTFAIQTLNQAVALDPINTNLRISLGGVYFAQGDFDSAIRVFELATMTKPDHANAHYNLAYALKEAGQLGGAINEMTLVLSLVDRESDDYEIARQALENMQALRQAQGEQKEISQPATGTELTPPEEEQEAVLQPPIELTEEEEPPSTPSPTPTPEEVDNETPSPTSAVTPTLSP